MTISSTTNRNDFTGNGATSVYSYSFRILDETDLLVTKRLISTGAETVLALTTDYTVSGVGSSGGSITLVAGALAATYKLTLRRVRPLTQETDIRNQGEYFPETLEDEFDRHIMIAQQIQDQLDRAAVLPETLTTADFDPTLPADIAGSISKALITNSSGDGFEVGPTASEITNAQTYATSASASASAASTSASASATSASASAASAVAAAASAASADSLNRVAKAGDTMTGNLTMNAQNSVRFADSDSSNYVGLKAAGTIGTNYDITLPAAAPTSNTGLVYNGSAYVWSNNFVAPTVQKFTSGSGTYTLPSSPRAPLYIKVKMVGGGGGGSGGGVATLGSGGTGGNTTFGTTLLVANGGVGGNGTGSVPGNGGTASLGTGPTGVALTGGMGCAGEYSVSSSFVVGGAGGVSPFGGAGSGGQTNVAGFAAITNSGSGGGGGGTGNAANISGGVGGGSGGFVDAVITSPLTTYSYAVGAAGTAGTAGTTGNAGGAGGSGIIVVEEFYQ